MEYTPKFGRVIIEREVRKQTHSGIIIPDQAAHRNAPSMGIIKALGETAGWCEDPQTGTQIQTMKVGDKVIFGKHSGAWLDATYGNDGSAKDDGSLFICADADILAVIKEDK